MTSFKRAFIAAALLPLAVAFSSCNKEKEEKGDKQYTMQDIVMSMTFDTFLKEDDVVIENEDTTSLLVSKEYMETVVKKEIVNEITYLAIWLKPGEYPFYRQVQDSQDAGDGRIRLLVIPADVSCCLPEGSYHLNTDVYRNEDEKPRLGGAGPNGTINSDYYYNPYYDEYHPVAIFSDHTGMTSVGAGESAEVNFANQSSPMVEDWETTKWTINPSLNIQWETKDKYFGGGSDEDDEEPFKIGLAYANLEASAGVRLTLDVGVKWNSKKVWFVTIWYPTPCLDEFAAAFNASFEAEYKAVVELNLTHEDEHDYTLFKCSAINAVFMIGPVPVLIDCEPEFIFRYEYSIGGGVGFANEGKISVGVEKGRQYKDGRWNNIENSKPFEAEFRNGIDIHGEFEGQLGLYLKIPLKIDKLVGPYLLVGTRLEAEAKGEYMVEVPYSVKPDTHADFEASLDWWAGAEVGAEIKFMNWKIGSAAVEFQLFKKNLFMWPEED